MSRTAKQEPRLAEPLRDPKEMRARIEAFSARPRPEFSAALFAVLRRTGQEF